MNAIGLLRQQHRAVEALFDRLGVPGELTITAEDDTMAAAFEPTTAEDFEEDPEEASLDPNDPTLAAGWQALPPPHGSKAEAVLVHRARRHEPAHARSADEHVPPPNPDDSAGRVASPAARHNLAERRQFDDDRQALFDDLAGLLIAHSTVEEQIFYPAARSEQTDDLLFEAIEDHASARRLIDELRRMKHTDPGWHDKLSLLREKVDNHVHDEETELFPNVEEELGPQRLQELGRLIEARYRTLMAVRSGPTGEGRPVSAEVPTQVRPPSGAGRGAARRLR